MLDLKAKLASLGLVTEEDIARVEKPKQGRKRKGGGRGRRGKSPVAGASAKASHKLDVPRLRALGRGEAYTEVRKWVQRVRLDVPNKPPTEAAKTFHFSTAKGPLGRLIVEPDVHGWLSDGSAAVIAYMSNHGLAHAVVPAEAGRALVELFPLWLRALAGDDRAGQAEPEPEPKAESEREVSLDAGAAVDGQVETPDPEQPR